MKVKRVRVHVVVSLSVSPDSYADDDDIAAAIAREIKGILADPENNYYDGCNVKCAALSDQHGPKAAGRTKS